MSIIKSLLASRVKNVASVHNDEILKLPLNEIIIGVLKRSTEWHILDIH